MAHRFSLGIAVLLLWCAPAAARNAAPLEGAGNGGSIEVCAGGCERCGPICFEIEVRANDVRIGGHARISADGARADADDARPGARFPAINAVDFTKGVANFPARVARGLSGILRFVRNAVSGDGLWGWVKQSLITPLVRLHAWQEQIAEVAQEVEVETAQSVVGEATGRSPGATGWAVRTRERLWVIEYRFAERAAEMPTLAINRGTRVAKEDPEVAVFTSPVSVPGTADGSPGLSQAEAGDGMEITAFRTEESGVGFLVRISGLVILHADVLEA